jgi:NADH-quinone oxidoreductase subunit F
MLIEGMLIAAYAGGINRAYIYVRGEYELQAQRLEAALDEAKAAGYIGDRVLGSDLSLTMWVHRGAGAYICGEETALLDSLEGARQPRLKPPFANQGLYRARRSSTTSRPSTAPHIIRMGGEEYAKLGVTGSTGTKLVGLRARPAPGQLRDRAGISFTRDHHGLGGPPVGPVKLWFPGGSSAPVLTGDDLDVPMTSTRWPGRLDARLRRDHRHRRLHVGRRRRPEDGEVLPPRVVRAHAKAARAPTGR